MKINPLSAVLSGSAGTHRRIKLSLLKEAAGVPCEAWGAGYKPSPVLVHGQETEAVKDAGGAWPVVKSVPGFKRLRRNASANLSGSAGTHPRIRVLRKGGQRCETSPPLQCNLALFD